MGSVGTGMTIVVILFMVALWNRADHYIFFVAVLAVDRSQL